MPFYFCCLLHIFQFVDIVLASSLSYQFLPLSSQHCIYFPYSFSCAFDSVFFVSFLCFPLPAAMLMPWSMAYLAYMLKVGLRLLLSVSLHSAAILCYPVSLIWVLRSPGHWTLFVPMHCSVTQCSFVILVTVVLMFFSDAASVCTLPNYGLTRCLPLICSADTYSVFNLMFTSTKSIIFVCIPPGAIHVHLDVDPSGRESLYSLWQSLHEKQYFCF